MSSSRHVRSPGFAKVLLYFTVLLVAAAALGGMAGSVITVIDAASAAPFCENDDCRRGRCFDDPGSSTKCDRTPAGCSETNC